MTASRTLVGTAARASLATAFIACGATADFTGMSTEASLVDQTGWTTPDARTLYVISVFADFDNADDHLTAVFGDGDHVLSVETSDDAGFWQFAPPGGDPEDYNTSLEIPPGLSALYASVTSDSFVTIGLTNSTDNLLQNIGVNFVSFNDGSGTSAISVDNGSWFITPVDPQGTAGNYTGNRVLIGQFTVAEGESVSGSVSLQWVDSAGDPNYSYEEVFVGTASQGLSNNDFNGDGLMDVLWRSANGAGSVIYGWVTDASNPADLTYSGDYIFSGTTQLNGWELVGFADFTGDGLSDILWRYPGFGMYVWKTSYNEGTGDITYVGEYLYQGTGVAAYRVEAVGDISGDGIADIVWRSSNGTGSVIVGWVTDASNPADLTYAGDYIFSGTTQLNGWQVSGLGDFDGDGLSDILWRYPGFGMYVWKMAYNAADPSDELTYTGEYLYQGTGVAAYRVEAVGDISGDGIADVVWRSANGAGSVIYGWVTDASNPADLTYAGDYIFSGTTQLNGWEIKSVGDMDGDGIGDLLWRYTGFGMYVWKMAYNAADPSDELTYTGEYLYSGTGVGSYRCENQN